LEINAGCPERLAAGRTMMGFGQEAWLYAGLAHSTARWNLIAQDVLITQLRIKRDGMDAFFNR
jgi:alkaline phosphatase D